MAKHNFSKAELLQREKYKRELLHIYGEMAICIAILIDCYDYSPEEVRDFISKHDEWAESYLNNKEDIVTMLKNIEDYCGVPLLAQSGIEV